MDSRHHYTDEDRIKIRDMIIWYNNNPHYAKIDQGYVWEQVEAGEPTIFCCRGDRERWGGKIGEPQFQAVSGGAALLHEESEEADARPTE